MATTVERLWAPADTAHLSRRDRKPGRYRAYVPDELGVDLPTVGVEAQRAAEDALALLARADERIGEHGQYLNHLLIRSESISSSWIEGNRITPKKLAIAELLHHGSRAALDVVGNVKATEAAINQLSDPSRRVSVADIEALQHKIEPSLQPGLRQEQNWVGGSGWSPLRAEFVPPPETEVPRLVEDLARFISQAGGNPVVRAAIVHAQFETIHPFADGNGRTGRAIIHTVLKRGDALRNTLIPISTVFAGDTNAYISGLGAFRATPQRLDEWIIGFAQATELAAQKAVQFAARISELVDLTLLQFVAAREAAGVSPARPRADAVSLRILGSLATHPVLTIDLVVEQFEVSKTAAQRALAELAEAGILSRSKDQKGRLICWAADEYLALVALTERSNRVGAGDTAKRKPKLGPPAPAKS